MLKVFSLKFSILSFICQDLFFHILKRVKDEIICFLGCASKKILSWKKKKSWVEGKMKQDRPWNVSFRSFVMIIWGYILLFSLFLYIFF